MVTRRAHPIDEISGGAFPAAAAIALANPQLRRNIANATRTIRERRADAVAELDDWPELRSAGAAIKDDVLSRLGELLPQFEAAVVASGGTVHWAPDAAAANEIVTELVRARGRRDVVKVKSMATQEIGLNEALAAAGINAWETDLAELIVQLGHDKPSHILVPAIHRNRAEIREIFLREMGKVGRPADAGLTDEPAQLAEAARLHLRQRFLAADIAISGANFGIAETGTVCVVESEGNGRMCLTLPKTLITVMGIEKLVPSWRDMEVFLQLLPRSSTGERMNPYTTFWTGVHDGDGPEEFHLVLLDNGRTATLADPHGRAALRCIRCSACLNVCPVYERTGGHAYGSIYPGPIGAVLSPQLTGVQHNPTLPFASTLCGACLEVCPVAIDIPTMLVHLRNEVRESEHGPRTRASGDGGSGVDDAIATTVAADVALAAVRAPVRPWRQDPSPPAAAVGLDGQPRSPCTAEGDVRRLVAPARWSTVTSLSDGRRHEVLERITQATANVAPVAVARQYRGARHRVASSAELCDLFVDRVEDYRAEVRVVTSRDDVRAAVGAFAAAELVHTIVIPPGLEAAHLDGLDRHIRVRTDGPPLRSDELDRTDAVVTSCVLAIAETGTIVLDGGEGQGRRALTLLPDVHIVIVHADQIVPSVPDAVAALDPTRPLTWISGPSATSDIELNRVEGVHGPRRLRVVLDTSPGERTASKESFFPATQP